VRVVGSRFQLSDTASRSLVTYAATLSQTLLQGRVTFDGEFGSMSRSWGDESGVIASGRITAHPTPWSTIIGQAEHFLYTATEASLATTVMPMRYSASGAISMPSGWMGEAALQKTSFESVGFVGSGPNDVTSAFAWVLAPVPGVRPHALQFGYSFAASNSDALMYGLLRTNQTAPPSNPNFDFAGIYSPYYTPRDIRVHSALGAMTVGDPNRSSIHVNGAYGFHATENAPHIVSVTRTPRGFAPTVVEASRRYSPWNLRAALTSMVTRAASLNVTGEVSHTAFYTAQTLSLSLDYTIGK
jgi:hypothetical protein